jgi:hypothetical protein
MEYEEKKEVTKEKIYNLFRCGYLDVREWLKETDIILIPLGSTEQHGGISRSAPTALPRNCRA